MAYERRHIYPIYSLDYSLGVPAPVTVDPVAYAEIPALTDLWERALCLPLTNQRVNEAFRSLQYEPQHIDTQNLALYKALTAVCPRLVLVHGCGQRSLANYRDGQVRLERDVALALNTITECKDTLRFYVLTLLMHELAYHVFRALNASNPSHILKLHCLSDRENLDDFGSVFYSKQLSGLYLEEVLWGGSVLVGVEVRSPPGQKTQLKSLDWNGIRTVSFVTLGGGHWLIRDDDAFMSRLEGPQFEKFTRDELLKASEHRENRENIWSAQQVVAYLQQKQYKEVKAGDRYLLEKLGVNMRLTMIGDNAHGRMMND